MFNAPIYDSNCSEQLTGTIRDIGSVLASRVLCTSIALNLQSSETDRPTHLDEFKMMAKERGSQNAEKTAASKQLQTSATSDFEKAAQEVKAIVFIRVAYIYVYTYVHMRPFQKRFEHMAVNKKAINTQGKL